MKKIVSAVTTSIFAIALCAGAHAQDHRDDRHDDHHDDHRDNRGPGGPGGPGGHYDNNHFVRHNDWHKGYHMAPNDWNRGDRVDYHQYHLAPPRRGYEWRRVDGNFVMAAVATGVIASLVVASAAH